MYSGVYSGEWGLEMWWYALTGRRRVRRWQGSRADGCHGVTGNVTFSEKQGREEDAGQKRRAQRASDEHRLLVVVAEAVGGPHGAKWAASLGASHGAASRPGETSF